MLSHTKHLNNIEKILFQKWEKSYFAWVRHIVTLSASGLTLLIGLKNNYIPSAPQHLWLIQLCWCLLAVSIASGLLVLYGEGQTYLEAHNKIKKGRNDRGDEQTAVVSKLKPFYTMRPIFQIFSHILVGCFLLSLFSLCVFAVKNIK